MGFTAYIYPSVECKYPKVRPDDRGKRPKAIHPVGYPKCGRPSSLDAAHILTSIPSSPSHSLSYIGGMAQRQRAGAGDVQGPAAGRDGGGAHDRDAVREVGVQERAQGWERAALSERRRGGNHGRGLGHGCEPAREGGEKAGGEL